MNQPPFREAREIEQRRINQLRLPIQDQIAENFSRCRRMHYSMPAESIGQKKSGHGSNLAQNRMVIRRHFIEPGPCPLRIHRQIGKTRNPVGRPRQNFLYKSCIELGLEAGRLLRIVPGQQESSALRPEVKSVGHVNDHGRSVRESIKGLAGHQHPPQRFHRQIDAGHFRHARRPGSGAVDDPASGNPARTGFDSGDAAFIANQPGGHAVFAQCRPVFGCPPHQTIHRAMGIDKTIRGTETSAHNIVSPQLRKRLPNFRSIQQPHVLQAHADLLFEIRAQVRHLFFAGRAKKVALRPVITGIAGSLFEARIERNRVQRHLDIHRRRELGPHSAHAFSGGSFALGRLAFQNHDIAATGASQVVGNAGADDSSANDYDVCRLHEPHRSDRAF